MKTLVLLALLASSCGPSAFRAEKAADKVNVESEKEIISAEQAVVSVEEETKIPLTCGTADRLYFTQKTLSFPARQSCQFASDQNLEPLGGSMQAFEISKAELSIDEKIHELCSISMRSRQDSFHYDDYMFFTLNNYVLIASESGWAQKLEAKDEAAQELKVWDWSKLKAQLHEPIETSDDYGKPYCLVDKNCELPSHDEQDSISWQAELPKTLRLELSENIAESGLSFKLVTTGDDDADDCFHSELTLDVSIGYVKKDIDEP